MKNYGGGGFKEEKIYGKHYGKINMRWKSPLKENYKANQKKGSAIWNLARLNRDLIREHSLWEIREGDKANFWKEAWQQRYTLNQQPRLQDIQQFITQMEEDVVQNYWLPERGGYWRK